MVARIPRQTDPEDNRSTDPFSDALQQIIAEEVAKNQGSRTKTPWSPQSYSAGSRFGVTVPKTYDEVFVETGTIGGIVKASDPTSAFYASRRQPTDVPNYNALPPSERQLFDLAAAAIHPMKSGSNYYEELITASWDLSTKGIYKSPQQLAYEAYIENGGRGGAAGGGRSGAYTGPVRSVTVQAETDIVASARAAAEELLGRMPTQQELDRILKRTRSAEQAQPTVQTRQGPGQVTTAEGLTKEGRDNILRQVLMQSPDYQDYQIDSTVMDMMLTNLRRGQEVARG